MEYGLWSCDLSRGVNARIIAESLIDDQYREVGKYPGILIGPHRWNTGTLRRFSGLIIQDRLRLNSMSAV
jgi:hypothetical protein